MRVPVLRISLNNATILSVVYLVVGIGIELVRRQWSPRWAERGSLAMEAFPARILDGLGLLSKIRLAYARSELAEWEVRVIYGVTTVIVIYAMGLAVGGLLFLIARQVGGADEQPPPPPGSSTP